MKILEVHLLVDIIPCIFFYVTALCDRDHASHIALLSLFQKMELILKLSENIIFLKSLRFQKVVIWISLFQGYL